MLVTFTRVKPKAFDRFCYAGLFQKIKSYGVSGQIFSFICSFISNGRFFVVLDGKTSQDRAINAGTPYGAILFVLFFSCSTSVIFQMILSKLLTLILMEQLCTLSVNCVFYLWQQLDLTFELESDLRNTTNCGRKCFAIFIA